MRKACLIVTILVVLVVGLILCSPRSLTIHRGLELDSCVAGEFTYKVWSYGNWIESTESGVHVSTFAPPYTVVLAIQPSDRDIRSIEILDAFVVDELGNKTRVLGKLKQPIENVESRRHAVIKLPYAAFIFDSAIDSNESTTLVIEFRTNLSEGSEKKQQSLKIQGYETKEHGFVILKMMSSA